MTILLKTKKPDVIQLIPINIDNTALAYFGSLAALTLICLITKL